MRFFVKGLDALNDVRYKARVVARGVHGIRRVTGASHVMRRMGGTTQGSPVNPWEEGDVAWIDRKCWARQYYGSAVPC